MSKVEEHISASKEVIADLTAFYRKKGFVESKRFQRFVGIAGERN